MHYAAYLTALAAFALPPLAAAEGLYSKSSAVLQLDEKSYDKLVKKSTQASIVEFYAPWCGHCKSLKPAYEKAAASLKDIGQVAAVNCDDEANKAFCNRMGVKGFPTLKTVRPTLTIGKPIVVDYNGARTAAGIVEAVKGLIANHVKRIADKDLDGWLAEKNDTAKAILFSDKSTTSALLRVLAVDYYGTLDIAQIRDKDTAAIAAFGITQYPTFVVLPGGTAPAVVYDGELSKPSMSAFLNRYAPLRDTSVPNASKAAKKASSSGAVDKDDDTTTPRSKDASPPPTTPPALFALVGQSDLQEQCLGPETLTCILALLPASSEDIALPAAAVTALASLGELQTKHRARGVALFPFFAVPAENVGASVLREELGLARDGVVLVAVNGRRGWWRRMPAEDGYAVDRVERWVDGIRLGEGAREKLPEGLVGGKGAEEVKAKVEEAVSEAKEEAKEKEEEATETAEVVEGAKEKAEEAEETVEEKVTHEEL